MADLEVDSGMKWRLVHTGEKKEWSVRAELR